ncbi:phosphoglycerate mutase [Ligilactobacillus pabuli]|uniref:Phosphoglycerate mutase n=1 Tax=Ligilactobacillus pabuli TaxID=2886039 RepID=A0ABQ5JJC9_9LACO|nr:histidine phosphatase family protein [Ligilactobacillus pabuli]GKS82221.1 phosphoglycerate mutase [Ligilactobacillus pabuli]
MPILYIVRHGQSQANAHQIMQGAQVNTPLSTKGQNQARQTAAKLSEVEFTAIFASPLARAAQTAQIIRPDQTVTYDWRLREFDYGQWDGQLTWKLRQDHPQFFDENQNLLPGSQVLSGGETHAQALARLRSFFQTTVSSLPSDARVLIVSHGYTIKLIVALLLGLDDQHVATLNEPDNAGVTKISWSTKTQTLLAYNQ